VKNEHGRYRKMGRTSSEVGEPRPLRVTIVGKEGLLVAFKPYSAEMLRELWRRKDQEGATSRIMDEHLKTVDYKVSRASVIQELNNFVALGIASYVEKTGKGGHHRVYSAKMTEEEFWVWLAKRTCETLINASNMPDLFKRALSS
jgi:hypothetical protein